MPILAGAAAVWVVLLLLLSSKGIDGLDPSSYRINLTLYLFTLVVLVLWCAGLKLYRARPASPIRFLLQLATSGEGPRRLVRGVPLLFALVVFMPAFSAMKSSIPLFNSGNWDAAFIAADRAIHGDDPWRLLQPLLGFPVVTSALSLAYFAWFFLMYGASIYFCFLAGDRELRARFFITYFASWTVCGVLLATVFASVGPCFVGPLLGDHRFDALMTYLHAADQHYPVLILRAQDFLLAAKLESSNGLGAGIAAMPSMHVAMAFLIALGLSKHSRAAGTAGFAFVAAILVATVHLGPHYAVDGYVAIAVTYGLWALAGKLAPAATRRAGAYRPVPADLPPDVATA
jgi:hypothetical protein